MPLTDVAVRNAKPKDKFYKLSDSGGLFPLIVRRGAALMAFLLSVRRKEKNTFLWRLP